MQYRKIGMNGCGCAACGKVLEPDDPVAICPDCGGIFCQQCVEDGTFAAHECESGDLEEEES